MAATPDQTPRIGIPVRLSLGGGGADPRISAARQVFEDVVALIELAGATAVRLAPADLGADALEGCDGFVLPGGGDVDPRRYGAGITDPTLFGIDEDQDALDIAVIDFALAAGRPLLTICRGMQLLNVVRGGSLHVDLPPSTVEHHRPYEGGLSWSQHEVVVVPGTESAASYGDAQRLVVACSHHQAIRDLGTGLQVSAQAADGQIEAVDGVAFPGWVHGVQWHPEADVNPDWLRVAPFKTLTEKARTELYRRVPANVR
jgi:putative glutamine amidotransferase